MLILHVLLGQSQSDSEDSETVFLDSIFLLFFFHLSLFAF